MPDFFYFLLAFNTQHLIGWPIQAFISFY